MSHTCNQFQSSLSTLIVPVVENQGLSPRVKPVDRPLQTGTVRISSNLRPLGWLFIIGKFPVSCLPTFSKPFRAKRLFALFPAQQNFQNKTKQVIMMAIMPVEGNIETYVERYVEARDREPMTYTCFKLPMPKLRYFKLWRNYKIHVRRHSWWYCVLLTSSIDFSCLLLCCDLQRPSIEEISMNQADRRKSNCHL